MPLLRLLGLLILTGCATAATLVPDAWRSVKAARTAELSPAPPHAMDGVTVIANQLFHGTHALTPRFAAIDSFDVSAERREVIFSARRDKGFDIGLVAIEGSDIHWVPEDPSDEVAVQWVPRSNRVSYIVRTPGGDVVRTVHIPTATQLSVDFPDAVVRAVRWEPDGGRESVVLESPDASQRIESMKPGGEERRTDMPPAVKLDVAMEPLAGGLLLRPSALRYGEKLPLVVWLSPELYAWNDARGELLRNTRVACAIVKAAPDAAFWRAVRGVQWLDPAKVYVVGAETDEGIAIVGSESVPPGRYLVRGRRVLVAPALVQSVAAGYITAQVKGTPPTNGR